MVNFTAEQMRAIMDYKFNIRNMSVIAHVDHGKSTLTDSLVCKAGIISARHAGTARYTDTRQDEQERGITIKSTGISMFFEYDMSAGAVVKNDTPAEGEAPAEAAAEGVVASTDVRINDKSFLINLIDSPGHVDFSSEVTAALRVTDGALVVVDCVEGVAVQTGTVLRQAMSERVKPVLMVNKVDRALLELQLNGEEIYQNMVRAIENVNIIIESYKFGEMDWQVNPIAGTVAFGSGLHQWGFTLKIFATYYAAKFNTTPDKLQQKLWGDWVFATVDGKSKWISSTSVNTNRGVDRDTGSKRAFVAFIMDPIIAMFQAVMNNEVTKKGIPKAHNMAEAVGVTLPEEIKKTLTGKPLLKYIMQKWIPAAEAILEMIVVHLPSPAAAQGYRVESLYDGPLDDEAAQAIRTCDTSETAPLMMYVSKMIPSGDNRFTAFGRVFSGKIATGQKVRILGPNYVPGKKTDLYVKSIQRVVIMMGRYTETVADIPAGNTCGLVGVDAYLVKSGTITTCETACCIKTMKFAVSPVVRVAVSVKNSADLPKLVEGLKKLSKSDPMVRCETTEAGEHIIAGCGELHLEICLKDLAEDFMKGAPIHTSDPVVTYMECITTESPEVLAKSANKHNRLFCTALPLNEEVQQLFDDEVLTPGMDPKERSKILREHPALGWEEASTPQKIWCFGHDFIGPNVFCERTVGVAYLTEIKDSVVGGFKWACNEGPMCEERVRGMKVWLNDVTLHADAIHRGMGQISPTSRRVTYAGIYLANPALLEPIFLVNITCPQPLVGTIYNVMSMRRGSVTDEGEGMSGGVANMRAFLPVAESFGFSQALAEATGGAAFSQLMFDHWQLLDGGDFKDPESRLGKVVNAIRVRKGLTPELPPLDRYLDKL
jgi:elongation factor 2